MFARWQAALRPTQQGALYYFGFYGAVAAYGPFLSVYFARRGFSGQEIGLLAAIGPLMAVLIGPLILAFADRRGGRVRLLSLGLAGTALGLFALALPLPFVGLLCVVTGLGVVGSFAGPLADGLLARMAERHGLAFGKMRLWGSVSWAIVAAAGGWLWQQVGFWPMFPLAGLLFLATIPVALTLREETPGSSQARLSWRTVAGDGRIRAVIGATFLLGLAMGTVGTFAGIYIDHLGGGQSLVGLFAAVTAVCELPTMHWSQRIMGRLGGPPTLLLAYVLLGGSYAGLGWIDQPLGLLLVGAVQGLGFGLFLPTTIRLVAVWAPPQWSATYQGILSAATWGLAPLIAGPLGGLIYDGAGPATVFLTCAAITAAGALVLIGAQASGVFGVAESPVTRPIRVPTGLLPDLPTASPLSAPPPPAPPLPDTLAGSDGVTP